MHLSAMGYNLKKYLKFIEKRSKSGAGILVGLFPLKERLSRAISDLLRRPVFGTSDTDLNRKHPRKRAYIDPAFYNLRACATVTGVSLCYFSNSIGFISLLRYSYSFKWFSYKICYFFLITFQMRYNI